MLPERVGKERDTYPTKISKILIINYEMML